MPGTLALVEALVVSVFAYQYRKKPSRHIGEALSVIWLLNIANVAFAVFFWGGL